MANSHDVELHEHELLSMHSNHNWQNWLVMACILHYTDTVIQIRGNKRQFLYEMALPTQQNMAGNTFA